MTVDEAFLSYLMSREELVEIFGESMRSNHLAEGDELPGLAVQNTGAEHGHHLGGSSGVVRATFDVLVWGRTFRETVEAGDVLRSVLQGYAGEMGDRTCMFAALESDANAMVAPVDASSEWVYRKTHTYRVKLRETVAAP